MIVAASSQQNRFVKSTDRQHLTRGVSFALIVFIVILLAAVVDIACYKFEVPFEIKVDCSDLWHLKCGCVAGRTDADQRPAAGKPRAAPQAETKTVTNTPGAPEPASTPPRLF